MSFLVMPAFLRTFSRHRDRPGQHDRGLGTDIGELPDAGARLETGGLAGGLAADQHGRGAIDDARRVARRVHVIDRLDLRIALHRDRIEARHLAHLHERRLQRGERLHRGVGPHVLVLGEDREPVDVLHRHDRFLEAPFVPCLGGALLAFDRIGIDVVAREAVLRRDQVGRDALRQEVGFDARSTGRPARRRPDAPMPMRLIDSTPPPIVISCWPDMTSRGGEVHRVEARGAEAIDLHARHSVAEAGDQRRGARDVAARFADRIDAAEHDVVDQRRIELVAVLDGARAPARRD